MATSAQRIANRANARLSTGPRTAAGKARSRLNAVTHGAYARVLLLEREDHDAFDAHLAGFFEALQPVGRYEAVLVERLAVIWWRIQRAVEAEAMVLEAIGYDDGRLSRDAKTHIRQLDRIGAVEHRLQQAFERFHGILDRRQALRRRRQKPPIARPSSSCPDPTRASARRSDGVVMERPPENWLRFVGKIWNDVKSMPWRERAGALMHPDRRLRGPPVGVLGALVPAGLAPGHTAMQHPPGRDHQNVILGLTG